MNMSEFEKLVDALIDASQELIAARYEGSPAQVRIAGAEFLKSKSALLAAYSSTQWHERKEDGGIDEPKHKERIVIENSDGYSISATVSNLIGDNLFIFLDKYEPEDCVSWGAVKRWCYLPKDGEG